jgi:hypothetical protein
VGFDTFRGLPAPRDARDTNPLWREHDFDAGAAAVEARLARAGFPAKPGTLRLIEGPLSDSLSDDLRTELERSPPSIVTIDLDYYSSTDLALRWLEPMLVSGTIVYFDDLWAFHGHPNYGELGALHEFNARGRGVLRPFDKYGTLSTHGHVYIFCRSEFEFAELSGLPPSPPVPSESRPPARKP